MDEAHDAPGPRAELGDVLRTTLRVASERAGTIALASAIVVVPFVLVDLLFVESEEGTPSVVNVFAAIANCWFFGLISHLTRDAIEGNTRPFGDTSRAATGTIGAVFGITLLTNVLIGLGFVLFVVPGVLAWVITFLAIPARVFEGRGVGEALRRSVELTRGNRAVVLGLTAIHFVFVVAMLACALGPYVVVETSDDYELAMFWTSTEMSVALILASGLLQAIAQSYVTIAAAVVYVRLAPRTIDADTIAETFA